jgi:predicted acyl esterase
MTTPVAISVPMRDGAKLDTRVWFPGGDGPFPVVLERGYNPGIEAHGARFAEAGYAYAEFGGWDTFYRHLPLITLDTEVVGKPNNLWQEYVSHSQYDDYWADISVHEKLDQINVPTYFHAGWYDNYPSAVLKAFQTISDAGRVSDLRIHVGPTDHMGVVVGDRDFGDSASQSQLELGVRWLDHIVRGVDNGVAQEPPITIFTIPQLLEPDGTAYNLTQAAAVTLR